MAITLVQAVNGGNSTTSCVFSYPNNTGGNLLTVMLEVASGGALQSIVDAQANTWNVLPVFNYFSGVNRNNYIAYAVNCKQIFATNSVTLTANAAVNIKGWGQEWNSGVSGVPLVLDTGSSGTKTGSGTGTAISFGSFNVGAVGNLVVSHVGIASSGGAIGAGWTTCSTVTLPTLLGEYQIAGTTGPFTTTATCTSTTWGGQMASFTPQVSGGAGSLMTLLGI